jgi:hypothetical protein
MKIQNFLSLEFHPVVSMQKQQYHYTMDIVMVYVTKALSLVNSASLENF